MGPLGATPSAPELLAGRLRPTLTSGPLQWPPLARGPSRGRARRWSYAAAADDHVALGCAVVDLGFAGTAFVWLTTGERVVTWERNLYRASTREAGATPLDGAWARHRGGEVRIDAGGGIHLDVRTGDGRLTADLDATDGTPAVCSTDTPRGGWNVTQKGAGYGVVGRIALDDASWQLDGNGWRDWTAGRQDRHTSWRWAAGAGVTSAGRRVGLNLSTGMNGSGPGENVVWWDGAPRGLDLDRLEPVGDPAGPWRLSGRGWELRFEPTAVRAEAQNLLVVRSDYVQPIGTFRGTLPGADGEPVEILGMPGVTEDHTAVW